MGEGDAEDRGRLEADARAIAKTALDRDEVEVGWLGHYQHPVFRVTAGSTQAVLKLFARGHEKAQREGACLSLLGGELSPRLLAEGVAGSWSFVLSERVNGLDLRHRVRMPGWRAQALARTAGEGALRWIARIHDRLQALGPRSDLVGHEPILALQEAGTAPVSRLASLLHESLGQRRIDRTLRCFATCEVLPAVLADRAIAHGDFQAKNVMVGEDGSLAVIDWENLREAPRLSDYVTLVRHLTWTDPITGILREAFGTCAPDERSLQRLVATYDVIKICIGLSSTPGWSYDLDQWLAYVDACLSFLEGNERATVEAASRHLLEAL